ncbi:elongation factor P maturation arginine rhamnosyltransferase EarP [Paucibacter sp. XJ19-41]|uniref:elongation factor P maturation arginine rhamnosyltransferase EarP n=1 Tax=Paucibacter sp. XJ19-41 TaxID=2927824 RepID=UPI002349A5D0|nr:elongation factor P maturation arginine rhamnosyltransferase EarP [Paucibacter sp. XJ19-41]MDC6167920.1 elongation factor P maturation arginine rhamnosyltransferase EarP [Paucibacter sp. XJ19-41]
MHGDLFCRVIDNYGDLGVSWRLARALAARGQTVRLWLDDGSALAWMAPDCTAQGIEVLAWDEADNAVAVGDVVVETFGCELPPAFVARMAARPTPPQWINLEYLSAEPYVERSHGLASPQFSGPGAGLSKRFFYPGFTPRTGGLLREPELLQRQQRFDAPAWRAARGIAPQPGERLLSLFAYANPALPALLQALADTPTLLLVCPGATQSQIAGLTLPPALRWQALPYLSQPEFDHLLWACDLNFVRGEDSFVRAQWAAKPFVWQIYPQQDGAHGPKLEAFMDLWLADATAELAAASRGLWRAWNGLAAWPASLPQAEAAQRHARSWRAHLAMQADLSAQLLRFIGVSG